jgi:hypothetical protein
MACEVAVRQILCTARRQAWSSLKHWECISVVKAAAETAAMADTKGHALEFSMKPSQVVVRMWLCQHLNFLPQLLQELFKLEKYNEILHIQLHRLLQ